MIDHDGHLWITDFGLATTQASATVTATGDLVGTLRYMSPEQASGRHGLLDHRTDIYSLGVTLYELLTLRPAFRGDDRQDLLRRIGLEEPRAPRTLTPSIPPDLETIVLKAMSKDAHDRYAAAGELAEDLRRFLDHKPVRARRPSHVERTAKWMRRHRAVVATALVTLLVALVLSTVAIARAYTHQLAERRRAETERSNAVANLRLALGAVDDMYIGVGARWLDSETSLSSTQKHFLEKALEIYEQIVRQPNRGQDLQHVAASSYLRMGKIHYYLDRHGEAVKALTSAVAIYEQLVGLKPQNHGYRTELCDAYNKLAFVTQSVGRPDEALPTLETAQRHAAILAGQFPESRDYRMALAVNDQNRADALRTLGRLPEAERHIRRARDQYEQLDKEQSATRDGPINLDVPINLYKSCGQLAHLLSLRGHTDEAIGIAQEALRRCAWMRSNHPDVPDLQRTEYNLAEKLGDLFQAAGRFEEVEQQYRKALESQLQTFKARVKPVQWSLAWLFKNQFRDAEYEEPRLFCSYVETQIRFAAVLEQLGKVHEAELTLGEAVNMSGTLADTHVNVLRYRVAQANSYAQLAKLLREERPDEARRAMEMAAAIWHQVLEQFPTAHNFQSGVRGNQRDLDWFKKQFPKSKVDEGAHDLKSVRLASDSVFYNHTTGAMLLEGQMWEEAASRFKKSVELRARGHAFDLFYLAMAYSKMDKAEEARNYFQQGRQSMAENMPSNAELLALRDEAAKTLDVADP